MKSRASSTSRKIDWDSNILDLFPSKKSKVATSLEKAGLKKVKHLLWILPLRIEKIPVLKGLNHPNENELVKGFVNVLRVSQRPSKTRGFKGRTLSNITLSVEDKISGKIYNLTWFNCYPSQAQKLSSCEELYFLGRANYFNNSLQFLNPDIIDEKDSIVESLRIIYPTINSVPPFRINQLIKKIPDHLWDLILETVPEEILKKNNLFSLKDSFKTLHGKIPAERFSEKIYENAKERLKYEDFFQHLLKIQARKNKFKNKISKKLNCSHSDLKNIFDTFPYELTHGQKNAVSDILNDISSGYPMARLIQGDVGCGKTSVAICACLLAHINQFQSAVMSPTESLALQHFENFKSLLPKLKVEILLGSHTNKQKLLIKKQLIEGDIDIIIGTHSLIQKDVDFKNLGIVVIDEQHKFGVNQRLELLKKSTTEHSIVMTATPIPRSLRLTQYGDLDVSIIKEVPKNKKGAKTRIVNEVNFGKFLNFINTRLSLNEQVYVVVPAIEEVENQNVKYLEEVYERFKQLFPNVFVDFIHGRMSSEEKGETLKSFKEGEIKILISTSVIEVGIDVHNATVMTIMSPERFGLSSLHQLRGRVGRGVKQGFCFLIIEDNVSEETKKKLKVIESTSDGFKIAEEDLKFRGEGNVFGLTQSGISNFYHIANPINDIKLLDVVKEDFNQMQANTNKLFQQQLQIASKTENITEII